MEVAIFTLLVLSSLWRMVVSVTCGGGASTSYLPDPVDCSYYTQCLQGGGSVRRQCGPSTFWDQSIMNCAFTCGQDMSATTAKTAPPTTAQTTAKQTTIPDVTTKTTGATTAGGMTSEAMSTQPESATNPSCVFKRMKGLRSGISSVWAGSVSTALTCAVECQKLQNSCNAFQVNGATNMSGTLVYECRLFGVFTDYLLAVDVNVNFYRRCDF